MQSQLSLEDKGNPCLVLMKLTKKSKWNVRPQLDRSPEICILPIDAQWWEPHSSYTRFSVVAVSIRGIVPVSIIYYIFLDYQAEFICQRKKVVLCGSHLGDLHF